MNKYENDQKLPDGQSCHGCENWPACQKFRLNPMWGSCVFSPSRFNNQETRQDPQTELESLKNMLTDCGFTVIQMGDGRKGLRWGHTIYLPVDAEIN